MKEAETIYCDFDGTITKKDAVNTFFEKFASPDWTKSEELWVQGKISSRENAIIQVGMVRELSDKELNDFINSIEIDEYFSDFCKILNEKNIELVILSDGFDLFIEKTLERLNLSNIKFYANHLIHKNNNKFSIEFPYFEDDCQKGAGMCKCLKIKDDEIECVSVSVDAVGFAEGEFYGGSADALVFGEGGNESHAEPFISAASQSSYPVVDAAGDQVPGVEVAGGVEEAFHAAFAERAALDDGMDRLEGVGVAEVQWTCHQQGFFHRVVADNTFQCVCQGYQTAVFRQRQGVGVAIERFQQIALCHTPEFGLQGKDIGVGAGGVEDHDALVQVVVYHAAAVEVGVER